MGPNGVGYPRSVAKKSSIARNTAVNAFAGLLMTFLNLVLTALLARGLDRDQFGIWAFLMVLTFNQGYFALLDGGMSVSALRKIVQYEHSERPEESAEVLATLRAHYLYVSAAGSLALFACGGLLLTAVWPSMSATSVTVVLATLVIRLFADTIHASNMMVLESRSSFSQMRLLEIGSLTSWTVMVALVLWANHGLMTLAILSAINSLTLVCVSTWVVSRHSISPLGTRFKWRRSIAKDLWTTGKWVAVQRLWSVIYAQMDRTIIAVVLGVALVGDYEIPYKFQAMGVLILSVFPSALFPTIAKLEADENRDRLTGLFHKATRWTVGLSLPMLITGIALSGPLIALWVGNSFVHLEGSVSLFLIWPVIASFNVIGSQFLNGMGKTKEMFLITCVSVLVNLIVSISLVNKVGINGVMLGTVIGMAVVFVPYLVVEQRLFGAGYVNWFKEVVIPIIPSMLIQIPILLFLRNLWANGANPFLVVVGGCLVTFIGLLIFILLSPEFRRHRSFKALFSMGS
jgi:O-antigen/teichoic acid export membrane protein